MNVSMLNNFMFSSITPLSLSWANGGMADTYVLGTYLARGLGSSPSSPTMTSLSSTTSFKKCCIRCCVDDKMLHCRKGMYRETASSKRSTSLRNYSHFSYIPTTAYFLAIATSFI